MSLLVLACHEQAVPALVAKSVHEVGPLLVAGSVRQAFVKLPIMKRHTRTSLASVLES